MSEQLIRASGEPFERLVDRDQVSTTGVGERQLPRVSHKQWLTEVLLKQSHLLAYRRLRDMKFARRKSKAQMASGCLKGT